MKNTAKYIKNETFYSQVAFDEYPRMTIPPGEGAD
jgi:hypothetical protein